MTAPVAVARAGRSARNEIVGGPRSRGEAILRWAAHPAVIGAIVFSIVVVRVFDKLLAPGLITEELALRDGGVTASGFIQLLPRLVIPLPPPIPLIAHATTIALVAAALVSMRIPPAAAVGLALLPMGERIYTTVLDAHFFMAIYLAVLALQRPSRWHLVPAAFAALNGGDAILLAPVYLLTYRRHRAVSAAVIAGAALQLAAAAAGERQLGGSGQVVDVAIAAVTRLGILPIGQAWANPLYVTLAGVAVMVVVLGSALASTRYVSRERMLVLAYLSAATLGAGLLAVTPLTDWWIGERYLVAGAWTLWFLAVASFPRAPSWPLLGLFAIGIAMNFVTAPERYPPL